jgi:hypothetical protein
LLTGAYEKAVTEFRQQILALSPDSPTARLARIFKALAEAGEQLRRENQDADVRATPVWEALNRASSALVDRR